MTNAQTRIGDELRVRATRRNASLNRSHTSATSPAPAGGFLRRGGIVKPHPANRLPQLRSGAGPFWGSDLQPGLQSAMEGLVKRCVRIGLLASSRPPLDRHPFRRVLEAAPLVRAPDQTEPVRRRLCVASEAAQFVALLGSSMETLDRFMLKLCVVERGAG